MKHMLDALGIAGNAVPWVACSCTLLYPLLVILLKLAGGKPVIQHSFLDILPAKETINVSIQRIVMGTNLVVALLALHLFSSNGSCI